MDATIFLNSSEKPSNELRPLPLPPLNVLKLTEVTLQSNLVQYKKKPIIQYFQVHTFVIQCCSDETWNNPMVLPWGARTGAGGA